MEEIEEKDSLICSSSEDGHVSINDKSSTDLEENYFTATTDMENDSNFSSVSDLESAIEKVRTAVLETEGNSEDRKKLVRRLIELRLKLQIVKEEEESTGEVAEKENSRRIISGHHFVLEPKSYLQLRNQYKYCDRCGGIIWTFVQAFYVCKKCSYQSHHKCLSQIFRACQFQRVSAEAKYISNICPEVGLQAQNYKCIECHTHFTLKNSWKEPRRCDYDGKYYCPLCHRNTTMPIPSRIIKNWDFGPRGVSEVSKQFLQLMAKKPNLNLEKLNPALFGLVQELNAIKRLREEIIIMKDFLITCKRAGKLKLLRLLEDRQHFVESSNYYSLQDLLDVKTGVLEGFLERIHSIFILHIKEDCPTCKGKGFHCEICENNQTIFPFDPAVHQCKECFALFHNICFAKRDSCPKCLRREKRKMEQIQRAFQQKTPEKEKIPDENEEKVKENEDKKVTIDNVNSK